MPLKLAGTNKHKLIGSCKRAYVCTQRQRRTGIVLGNLHEN